MTKERILIVENDEITAQILEKNLSTIGYDVIGIVPNGERAILHSSELHPDLVLLGTDLDGEMDAQKTAEQIRSQFNIPVIYLASHSEEEIINRGEKAEPFRYLHKPIDPKILHNTIEMALYKHHMERELLETERKYRSFIEKSGDGIYGVDEQGSIAELEKQVNILNLDLEKANKALKIEIAECKHAKEEIRLRSARVEALANIAARLNVGLDIDKILNEICKETAISLNLPACGIIIFEEKYGGYHLAGSYGLSKDDPSWFNQTPLLKIKDQQQESSQLITFQEVQSSFNLNEKELHSDKNISPLTYVTLNQDSDVIGALYIFSFDEIHQFSEDERVFLKTLANQVTATITNARLFEQVHSGRERLKKLSQQLIAVQEAERRFIAKELHDEIGQTLTSLKLSLELISKENFTSQDQSYFNQAQDLVYQLLQRVRQMSLDLRPGMLDDLGLLPALLYLFERYNAQTNINVNFVQSNIERRFDQDIETTAYRIIQEALTNVARHASINQAFVRIWADEKILGLQVEDEGAGFILEADVPNKYKCGFSGMKERAILVGGNLEIESALGEGTRITAELPIDGKLERRIDERFDPFS